MSTARPDDGSKKRKPPSETSQPPPQPKKQRSKELPAPRATLVAPHEAIIAELQPKYDVLVASVISSTQIRKRVALATAHLAAAADRPRLVLLHARAAQVCKMITVVEYCKRLLAEKGGAWYQYNQLFELPLEPMKVNVVEETVLNRNAEDSDGDDFEVMRSRIEQAVLPPPPSRTVKSMRIFLSSQPIPELRARDDITVQACDETKT